MKPIHLMTLRALGLTAAALLGACGSGGDTGGQSGPGPGPNTNNTVSLAEVDLDFEVANYESTDRHETVSASIPFPKGAVNNLNRLGIAGEEVAWLPLQHWADGSVRIGQVQLTTTVEADTTRTFRVEVGQTGNAGAFSEHPWVTQGWSSARLGARVRDTFGHLYEAEVSGDGELLQSTALKRVRRWRLYHETTTSGGIGRDFLTSTFYVTDFRDTPYVIVDWVFSNDYLGADDPAGSTDPNLYPLGPVDVDDVALLTAGFAQVTPFKATWHDIQAGVVQGDGRTAHVVMENDWLGDGQGRRYRFMTRFEDSGANPVERQDWADAFEAFAEGGPAPTLGALRAFQQCKGLGLLGGPVDPPPDAVSRADSEYNSWLSGDHFGTWGSFGDNKNSHATGTPRNSGLREEVAHAAQSRDLRLLMALEQKAWAQAQRPYHLYGLEVGAEDPVQLWDGIPIPLNNRWARDFAPESFGRRALQNSDPWSGYRTLMTDNGEPHDWTPYDISHWTIDLYFDYWTLTGDEWAKEEMRQLGESLRGVMHYHGYTTDKVMFIRAEGWTMQAAVQSYLATGDERFKTKAVRRTNEIIETGRHKTHASRALRVEPNATNSRFPGSNLAGSARIENEFITSWQNYAVFYGYLAAYEFFDDPLFLTIAEDSVHTISYSFVENYTDNLGNFRTAGLRYSCLFSVFGVEVPPDHYDSDPSYNINFASGTATMNAAGLLRVARLTRDAALAAEARRLAFLIVPTLTNNSRWNKWTYMLPEEEYTTVE